MKFGKKLALDAIPEWRVHYIRYHRLKRLLKQIQTVTDSTSDSPLLADRTEARELDREFFSILQADVVTVNNFFDGMLADAAAKVFLL